jgi:hypothetical protein
MCMSRSRHLVTAATNYGHEADTGRFSNRYADFSPADIRPSLRGGGRQTEFRQSEPDAHTTYRERTPWPKPLLHHLAANR